MPRQVQKALEEEEAFGHFFLLYPVFMIVGAAWWFAEPTDPPVLRLVAWAVVLMPSVYLLRHARNSFAIPVRLMACILLGAALAAFQTHRTGTVIMDAPVTTTITARIRTVEIREEGRWRYTVDILRTEHPHLKRPPSSALLGVRGQASAYRPGDVIKGLARLQPLSGPVLPGSNDFAFDSYFKGIGAIGGFLGKPKLVEREETEGAFAIRVRDQIQVVRSSINQRMMSVLGGDVGAFASALVTNDTAAFSKDALAALREAGLAHVIAISGLHMVLAAGISFVGLRLLFSLFPTFIQTRPAKAYAAIGAVITSGLYLLISGMPVSATRAFIMLSVAMGGVMAARAVVTLRSIALAAIAILVVTPSAILGPSFQMSFSAATALVSGYSLWRFQPSDFQRLRGLPFYQRARPIIRAITGIMLTSEIAGLATAIFSVSHFHRLVWLGTLGNVAAMPIISLVVMPAGFVAVLLMPLGLDAVPLWIMGFGLRATLAVAKFVASLGGEVTTGALAVWVLPAASGAFLMAVLPHSRLFRITGAFAFALAVAGAMIFGTTRSPSLVIAETGDLVGIVSQDAVAVNRPRPSTFVADQWMRALAAEKLVTPASEPAVRLARPGPRQPLTDQDQWQTEDAMEAAGVAVLPGRFLCSGRDWCLGKFENGLLVATFSDFAFQEAACHQADIVVAASYLRQPNCGEGEAVLLDRSALRLRGAVAVFVKTEEHGEDQPSESHRPHLKLVGALDGKDRPWLRHRFYDWRSDTYGRPYGTQ